MPSAPAGCGFSGCAEAVGVVAAAAEIGLAATAAGRAGDAGLGANAGVAAAAATDVGLGATAGRGAAAGTGVGAGGAGELDPPPASSFSILALRAASFSAKDMML